MVNDRVVENGFFDNLATNQNQSLLDEIASILWNWYATFICRQNCSIN
jgi:hypothetical protein